MAEHGHIVEGVHYVIHDPFSKIAITDPSKLLGRDKELLDLKNFLASGEDSLLIVKGKRQVGKSSLLKSFLAMTVSDDKRDDLKLPFKVIPIYLSMDNIMNMEMMKTTLGVSVESTFSEVITFVKKPKHVKKFQKVLSFLEGSEKHYSFPFNIPFLPVTAGLEIGGKGHELFMKAGLRGMIDAIGLSAENCDKSVALIVLDEVQQATRWKLEEKTEFLSILKHVQDNKRNVKVILTGSDIRLMNQLLDKEFMDIMYNRAIGNLTLYPFDRDQSKTFLESGFRRGKLSIPAEIENYVVNEGYSGAEGLPGALVKFGNYFVSTVNRLNKLPNKSYKDNRRKTTFEEQIHLIARRAAAEAGKVVSDGATLELEHLLRTVEDTSFISDCKKVASSVAVSKSATSEYLSRLLNIPKERIEVVLSVLSDKGVVKKGTDNSYVISDNSFDGFGRLEMTERRLGEELIKSGLFEEGIDTYSRLIEESYTPIVFPDVYFNRAYGWRRLGGYWLAMEDLKKLISISEEEPDVYAMIGDIYEAIDDLIFAIEYYQKSLTLESSNELVKIRLETLLKKKKQEETELEAVSADTKKTATYHGQLADFFLKWGKYEDSVTEWQSAIKLNSSNPSYYFGLSLAFNKLNRLKEACSAIERAQSLDPNEQSYLNNFGYYLAKLNNYTEGVEVLNRAVEIDKREIITTFSLLEAYVMSGKEEVAFNILRKGLERNLFTPKDVFVQANKDLLDPMTGEVEHGFLLKVLSWDVVNPIRRGFSGSEITL